MDVIRTVELFAGVGGFRLGLERASGAFRFVWADQWEPAMQEQYAFDCYETRFGHAPQHICQDIAKVKQNVPEHDLLVGGFPCQDYSIMKKNARGIEGPKGALWWQIDAILQKKRPPYVLLENVDRILRSPAKQYGRDFSIILRSFYDKSYAVEWRVINAADHGAAQRRRRTFIVAYHASTQRFRDLAEGTCIHGLKYLHHYCMRRSILAEAFPILSHSRTYTEGWIDEMVYQDIPELSRQQRIYLRNTGIMMNGRVYSVDVQPRSMPALPLRSVLENGPLAEHYFLRAEDLPQWIYAKGAKRELRRRKDGTTYIFSEGAVPFPDPLDRPARTLVTSEGRMGRASHVITDPYTGRLRTLTPMECERLNGFPDGWTDTGMPERMRYFCMGNALVVPIVQRIGTILAKDIP